MGLVRLLLALAVVFGHAGPPLRGVQMVHASTAVQMFYVISGFYMGLVLTQKYRPGNYRLFLTNRFLRIVPAYYVVLLLTIGYQGCALVGNQEATWTLLNWRLAADELTPCSAALIGLANVTLLGQDAIYFTGLEHGALHLTTNFAAAAEPHTYKLLFVPQAWSLGIELMFYLLAPLLVWRGVRTMLVVCAASLLLRVVFVRGLGLDFDPWNYRFFPLELGVFLLGSLAHAAHARFRDRAVFQNLTAVVAGLYVAFLLGAPFLFDTYAARGRTALLLATTVALPFLHALTSRWTLDRLLGEASYPVYLCHILVIWVLADHAGGVHHAWWISVAFAYVLYGLVVAPIDRLRARRAAGAAGP